MIDHSASYPDLLARQAALQAAAAELLAGLDLAALVADIGPLLLAGSVVSGLMSWPEIDVMLLAGPDFAPADVLRLLARIVAQVPVTALDYRDERGPGARPASAATSATTCPSRCPGPAPAGAST